MHFLLELLWKVLLSSTGIHPEIALRIFPRMSIPQEIPLGINLEISLGIHMDMFQEFSKRFHGALLQRFIRETKPMKSRNFLIAAQERS